MAVIAVGWRANTAGLNLVEAGVETDSRGFVRVDRFLQTSASHIFAAGDVTGRLLLVPPAIQDGFVAATNAVRGPSLPLDEQVHPIGSFTDPEYAQVGITESQARAAHDVVAATIRFDATTRTIIDGRTFGFCKMIVDRTTRKVLGCHVVGERAVEITQVAAIVMTAGSEWTNLLMSRCRSRPTQEYSAAWRAASRENSISKVERPLQAVTGNSLVRNGPPCEL